MPPPAPPHTPSVMGTGVGWKLQQVRTLSSPGRGSREGAGERAKEAAANFPPGCCLHPSDELALGFPTSSPGQVCQERLAGSYAGL